MALPKFSLKQTSKGLERANMGTVMKPKATSAELVKLRRRRRQAQRRQQRLRDELQEEISKIPDDAGASNLATGAKRRQLQEASRFAPVEELKELLGSELKRQKKDGTVKKDGIKFTPAPEGEPTVKRTLDIRKKQREEKRVQDLKIAEAKAKRAAAAEAARRAAEKEQKRIIKQEKDFGDIGWTDWLGRQNQIQPLDATQITMLQRLGGSSSDSSLPSNNKVEESFRGANNVNTGLGASSSTELIKKDEDFQSFLPTVTFRKDEDFRLPSDVTTDISTVSPTAAIKKEKEFDMNYETAVDEMTKAQEYLKSLTNYVTDKNAPAVYNTLDAFGISNALANTLVTQNPSSLVDMLYQQEQSKNAFKVVSNIYGRVTDAIKAMGEAGTFALDYYAKSVNPYIEGMENVYKFTRRFAPPPPTISPAQQSYNRRPNLLAPGGPFTSTSWWTGAPPPTAQLSNQFNRKSAVQPDAANYLG